MRAAAWGVSRPGRGARRGRPRGSRHALSRRPEPQPADNASAVAAGMLLIVPHFAIFFFGFFDSELSIPFQLKKNHSESPVHVGIIRYCDLILFVILFR